MGNGKRGNGEMGKWNGNSQVATREVGQCDKYSRVDMCKVAEVMLD